MRGLLHVLAALSSGTNYGTPGIWDWLIPRISLDVLQKRRISCLYRDWNPAPSACSAVADNSRLSTGDTEMQFRLLSRCIWCLRSSGMLRCFGRQFVIDVSVRPIGPLLSNLVLYAHTSCVLYVVPKRRFQTDDLRSATSQWNEDLKCTVAGYLYP